MLERLHLDHKRYPTMPPYGPETLGSDPARQRKSSHGWLLGRGSLPLAGRCLLLAAGAGTSRADGEGLLTLRVTYRNVPCKLQGHGDIRHKGIVQEEWHRHKLEKIVTLST